jgi:aminoglycoside phosphotransferase
VYRVRRASETFYLRVLPEVGASFAPEARALTLLRERGVRVPRVLYVDPCDEAFQRSVMLTSEIAGRDLGHRAVDDATRLILYETGRDLALLNEIPVDGFGWVRRDLDASPELRAEHVTFGDFVLEHLVGDLSSLEGRMLTRADAASIRSIVAAHPAWLTAERASLAHGDFDVTAIYQQDGRYTGIIDFGEIRGTDVWYDLGHFRMRDGETVPALLLDWLVEGYASVTRLPADSPQRVAFASLLIAVRALARDLERRPERVAGHQGLTAIPRDLALLQP